MASREELRRKAKIARARALQRQSAQDAPQGPAAPPPEVRQQSQERQLESERRQRALMPGGAAGRPEGMQPRPLSREEATMGGGLGGAVTGGLAGGAIAGAPGALIGTVVGGMGGSYGGSLVGDKLEGEDLDYAKAMQEAAISLGIDVATLGAGKFAKPVIKNNFVPLMRRMGFTPKEAAEEIAAYQKLQSTPQQKAPSVGSPESIRRTQQLFSDQGTTLTPYQTNEAGRLEIFGERIARIGLVSQNTMARNLENQTEVIRNELNKLTTSLYPSGRFESEELASSIYNTISAGKTALQDNYLKSLDEISGAVAGKRIPTRPVSQTLTDFVSRGQREFGSIYDKQTLDLIEEFQTKINKPGPNINASDLIDFEKTLQKRINQLGDRNSPLYNSDASFQLADLSSSLRDTMVDSLGRINPDVASKFSSLKSAYSEGYDNLLPAINKNFINAAGKNDFKTMGSILTNASNPSSIRAWFKSIDTAFEEAGKSGADLAFKSADEAKDAIRSTFIREQFSGIDEPGGFAINKYSDLARRLEKPSEVARYRAILGDNYPQFKQLANAMSEASAKPESNLGSLVIRSQEYAAALGAIGSVTGGNVTGMLATSGILTAPIFLAKMVTSGSRVNRILAFNKREFSSEDALMTAAYNLSADLFDDLSEEDQRDIRESMRESEQRQGERVPPRIPITRDSSDFEGQ